MRRAAPRQLAIDVRSVSKAFTIPSVQRRTVREHALDLFRRRPADVLPVLDEVSLTVARGESVALMGRNGSGKSTLLKVIAGIFPADRGAVQVSGQVTPILELGVGFNPELDAIDNVYLLGTVMGLSLSDIRGRIDEILAFAELERFARLKLQHFSSGMAARLAYAVAFSAVSEILLLDEIFAVGDAAFKTRCEDQYKSLLATGHTVLMVSHDPYTVAELCDRAILLEGGRIVLDGPAADVADAYLRMLGGTDAVSVAFEARTSAAQIEPRGQLVPAGLRPAMRSRLACPDCQDRVDIRGDIASCGRCGYARSQAGLPHADLRPSSVADERWTQRQANMEAWYARLASDPLEARRSFQYDYEGLAPLLETVHGAVLDLGGGLGLARQYVAHSSAYVIVEPSTFWLEHGWTALEPDFPVLGQPVDFIRGHGEHLPVRDASFDTVLALWSLNHAIDPARMLQEIHRVLRDEGRLIAVLDDMVPSDADVAAQPWLANACVVSDVPDDHVEIGEAEFLSWLEGRFVVHERRWIRHYLTFDIRRATEPANVGRAAYSPELTLATGAVVRA